MRAQQGLPLSAAQLGIWLGQQLDSESPAYWTAEAIELIGDLNVEHFERALTQAIDETECLHMRYVVDGDQVLQQPNLVPWALEKIDFSAHGEGAIDAAMAWVQASLAQAANLESGPLFATALLRLAPQRHLWVLRAHHVALDGFAYAALARRVAGIYSGLESTPSKFNLAAVIEEDVAYRQSDAATRDKAFWHQRLCDAAPAVTLAAPKPLARSVRRLRGELDSRSFAQWQDRARALGADWTALALAGVSILLWQRTGARDLTIGLPVMNRLGSVAISVPCMAMNIVPLHIKVDEQQGLKSLVDAIAQALRTTRPHQRYRYEWMKQDLGRTSGDRRLFGPVVNLMPFDRPLEFGALSAISHPVSAGPVEDLAITLAPSARHLRLDVEANPNAYDDAALSRCHSELLSILGAMIGAASDVPLEQIFSQPTTRATSLLTGGELTPLPFDVLGALLHHARQTPTRIAIEQEAVSLSYMDLLSSVQRLAGLLRALGVGAESRVVVLLPRAPDTVTAVLAILWAGGAYVPIDPDSPAARIRMVLEDSKPSLVITLSRYAESIDLEQRVLFMDDAKDAQRRAPNHADSVSAPNPTSAPASAPMQTPLPVPDDALAYVIYTSGSTGRPNGVMIGRDALMHFLAGARQRYEMHSDDRVLQFAPLHFDASVEEIFLSIVSGATLVLRTDEMLETLPRFASALQRLAISVLDLPTAFWHELAYSVGQGETQIPDCVRLVIIGGEAALADRVNRWCAKVSPRARLLNTYGPTEATVICTTAELAGSRRLDWDGDVPIGTPLPGVTVAVVDSALRIANRGEPGELCLLGGALARGYLGREDATSARFVRLDALPGSPRAYRTGDKVTLDENGTLRYLGRLDDEFKISGYRVDPAEIETALLAFAGIREAAVVGQTLGSGSKRLAAFLVTDNELPPTSDLRAHLSALLPPAAIPTAYARLPRLPRNANGKIDRTVLRDTAVESQRHSDAAATPTELAIMSVWRHLLGVEQIDPSSNFFALGGTSLQAIQLANRLSVALQCEVPVSALFRAPTIAELAYVMDARIGHFPPKESDPFAPLLTIQSGDGPALFCVHPAEGLSWCYMGLVAQLPHTPIYGLQARGIAGDAPTSIDDVVADYLALIRRTQSAGPYRLMGWSSGGGIAHAVACRLREEGEQVSLLAMMDSYPSDIWHGKPFAQERDALIALLDVIGERAVDAAGQPLTVEQMRARFKRPGNALLSVGEQGLNKLVDTALHSMRIYRDLRHRHFDGDVLFFHAAQRAADAPDWQTWSPYVGGRMECVDIDSTHNGMSKPAPLSHIGRELAARL